MSGNNSTLDLTSDTVNASNVSWLTVNGNGNTVDTSGVANLTVNGNSSVIDATSGMTNLTVNGNSSTITASGVSTMNLSGSATLTGSNDTVNMGVGATLTLVSGNGNTVTESQDFKTANAILDAAGASETFAGVWGTFDVTAQATGDTLTLGGEFDILAQTGGDAFGSVSVTGYDDTLSLTSAGVSVNVSSNYSTLNLAGDTVNDNNVSGLTVGGNSNTINVIGTTGLTINGNSDTINATGVTGLIVNGNATLNGSNDAVNIAVGEVLTVESGSGNTVTESQDFKTASVVVDGTNLSETVAGVYSTFDVTAQATGDVMTLGGEFDTLAQTGGDAFGSVSVTGYDDTLSLTSAGVSVNVSSNYSTLNLAGDTVNDNNVSGLTVGGNSNTINVTGTTGLTINGNSDTINATGVTGLIVNGNATLNGSNNAVNMGSGSALTVANGSGANTFDTSNAASDTLAFGSSVTSDQLWFSRSGNNLLITVDGTSETETIANWFDSTYYQIGTVKDGSGDTISSSGINSLVQAMASMTPPPMGQMNLSTTQQQQLAPVLAANWH